MTSAVIYARAALCLMDCPLPARPDSLYAVNEAQVIGRHREAELSRIIPDDEDGPDGQVSPRGNAVEVDERDLEAHGFSEADIVPMGRVRASIPIAQETIASEAVVIGTFGGRRDRQRKRCESRLEDPLRSDERHPLPVELEPLPEDIERQNVIVEGDLLREPAEGGHTDRRIPLLVVLRTHRLTPSCGT